MSAPVPDTLTVARAAIGAATTTEDPEARAYVLASATLALATLEGELRETRRALEAVQRGTIQAWKATQLRSKP